MLSVGRTSFVSTAQGRECYISDEYQEYCNDIGKEYGVCPELLMAIIESESSGDAKAKNGSCVGLMQVDKNHTQKYLDEIGAYNIMDPVVNIEVGTIIFLEKTQYSSDVASVLMMYHGESDWREREESGHMSKYAQNILDRSAELERIHGK